ncbi:MBL fold metallo-hydrolase [Alcanivorax sp.]|uniref:MBL fold metallo-hydrolase n=1 Tax=Alcanivorax sp. TaxID=1872427 RepID=UPI0025BBEAF9|nr:MBL fold metallo-hydrolase [Alcanivorax sp.]
MDRRDAAPAGAFPYVVHHGAVQGVTGSAHEWVVSESASVLIDCGLFQGRDVGPAGASASDLSIDFDISRIQAVVLTHVHIDHVGRLPWLFAAGYDGPVFCSEPSARLLPIVLEDAFKLGISRQPDRVEAFLTLLEQRLVAVPYEKWQPLPLAEESAFIQLLPAGHILGSASVSCRDSQGHVTVFSGDLGARLAPILRSAQSPYRADCLVIESTYGDRLHEGRAARSARLERALVRAMEDRGTLLIPAFSIGRTQELLYELEGLIHKHRDKAINPDLDWDALPIILDSPLASRFTRVYRELDAFWDVEARERLGEGRNPLGFEQLLTVDDHGAHVRMVRHLAESARPAVVIAASGMCAGGRIMNYLKAMLGDARHNLLFVGYQAWGTPGRTIQQQGQGGEVELDGERYPISLPVTSISGYSAHGDQQDLLDFVGGMQEFPTEVRVVHGDDHAKAGLKTALEALYGRWGLEVRVWCP